VVGQRLRQVRANAALAAPLPHFPPLGEVTRIQQEETSQTLTSSYIVPRLAMGHFRSGICDCLALASARKLQSSMLTS
jgi:hypothetical protein